MQWSNCCVLPNNSQKPKLTSLLYVLRRERVGWGVILRSRSSKHMPSSNAKQCYNIH